MELTLTQRYLLEQYCSNPTAAGNSVGFGNSTALALKLDVEKDIANYTTGERKTLYQLLVQLDTKNVLPYCLYNLFVYLQNENQ